MDLHYATYYGGDIASVLAPLARLRIAVFRDFPYLYEGTPEYEWEYLQTYVAAERALLFGVFDGEHLVGATTCIPLSNETEEVQAPFLAAGCDVSEIFYFGESILLSDYRGLGLGHRFFDVREAHAASFGTYRLTCFCAVERPTDHPLRPAGYRPLDDFWTKRGYRRTPELRSVFAWPDLGETESTPKPMLYWTRPL